VRKRSRKRAKSDRLDARAVAEFVWREGSALPTVVEEDETAVLDLLVSEREDLLAEATRLRNRIHQLLLQVDPRSTRSTCPNSTVRAACTLWRGIRLYKMGVCKREV
jgi:transposase